MLPRLRLDPRALRGRRYPEPAHPYRNDIQRDRDRIIHSRAFRRLEGKTQVFGARYGDHFRNRLTHTIEVSQVARTVASALELNEEFTETLALAHDLGHPPFGHVGEKELNRQMQRFGDAFEHNLHALRIVDLLEDRYPRFPGLNLTFEVREGIVKHSREVEAAVADQTLREFLPGLRPPLEAQIIDIADEIAYGSADLDDAFSAHLVTFDDLAAEIPQAAGFVEEVEIQFPGASERIRFWEVLRRLMDLLIGGLIQGTAQAAQAAAVQTPDDVRTWPERLARLTPETRQLNARLRALLVNKAYSYTQLVEDRNLALNQLKNVFEYLLEHPLQVSAGYRQHLEDTPVHRVICDYLAGMTDAYLVRVHAQLIACNQT